MDAGSIRPKMEDFFRIVDFFVCSKDFLFSFGGDVPMEQVLQEIHDMGCKYAVATLGEEGCLGYDGIHFYHEPAFPVKVVDTTGAGDVFHGAFAGCLAKRMNWHDILKYSNAAAALSCTKQGGRTSIPTIKEVEKFMSTLN